MRRMVCWAWITLTIAGCLTTEEERAHDYNSQGVRLYQQGNFSAAQQDFQAALQLSPGDADLVYNIGQCYEKQNDLVRAEQTYSECLRKNPNHAASRFALAALMIRQGRKPEATHMVEDWLRTQPR